MRTFDWTGQFKCDCKREGKGQYRKRLDKELFAVVDFLANADSSNKNRL